MVLKIAIVGVYKRKISLILYRKAYQGMYFLSSRAVSRLISRS